jgi:CHAT domain-containing protein
VGPKASFGFLADADGITAYEIDLTQEEAKRFVKNLRFPMEKEVDPGDLPPKFVTSYAHELYQRLFEPIGSQIAGAKHIIAVPSGPLLSLPFGVLVAEPHDWVSGSDYSEVPWMARRYALTLSPSVQSFVNLRKTVQPSRAPEMLIGFGDFVPHSDPDAIIEAFDLPNQCRQAASALAGAPSLPDTAQELKQVAALLGAPETSLVLGSSFSEAVVRQSNLESYRIVFFATHGLLPHELNCFPEPALMVSMPALGTTAGDCLLTTSEIVDLRLDADLVVLSACNTGGAGNENGGEALSGLARAFFYAGARSILATHWSIPTGPTKRLLTGMFENLVARNLSLAEALCDAQTRLIQDPDRSHPVFWGAFTVIGDGGQRLTG